MKTTQLLLGTREIYDPNVDLHPVTKLQLDRTWASLIVSLGIRQIVFNDENAILSMFCLVESR